MPMNDLLKERFFSLLAESSQVTNEKMQNAYAQFTAHMEAVNSSEDHATTFRTLNISRIEVAHLQTVFQYEQGEKCPKINLSAKGISTYQC